MRRLSLLHIFLCAGCVTTDVIVSPVDALPEPGQLGAVRSTQVHVGGCAANAAIDLAKLGLPAMLCALVGDDSFGPVSYTHLDVYKRQMIP